MVVLAVAGLWRRLCNLWIILVWNSVAIPSYSINSRANFPDPKEALGRVSCNAHRQRRKIRVENNQIYNDKDDTNKGEDGTDDIHADAGVHLKDIKEGNGEQRSKLSIWEDSGHRTKEEQGRKERVRMVGGRNLLVYPRAVR